MQRKRYEFEKSNDRCQVPKTLLKGKNVTPTLLFGMGHVPPQKRRVVTVEENLTFLKNYRHLTYLPQLNLNERSTSYHLGRTVSVDCPSNEELSQKLICISLHRTSFHGAKRKTK